MLPLMNGMLPLMNGMLPLMNGMLPLMNGMLPLMNGMLPLMNGMLPLMNGMLPLYTTQVSYPKLYATTLGDRLWKWYVTDCLVTYPVMQPLIEMVGNRFMQPK
jgi:hypothetical protein